MTLRVFFSHSSQDYVWIEPIVAQVQAMGLRGYVYEHDQQPGHPIAPKIKSAITRSQVVVAFLTLQGHDAPYVQQEIGYAISKDKLIVPFVERGVPERSIGMLQGIERINFDPQQPQVAISDLLAYLSRHTIQWLSHVEPDKDVFAGSEPEYLSQPSHYLTPPLLTMTVSIDRETAIKLLGLALLTALVAYSAYVLLHQSGPSET